MLTKGKEEKLEHTEIRAPKVEDIRTLFSVLIDVLLQRQSLDKEGEPHLDVAYESSTLPIRD